jgi:hypothetical protein
MKVTYCMHCRRDLWKGETVEQHVLDNHPYDVKRHEEYKAFNWTMKGIKEFFADTIYPQA